ncbi:MAG: flavodoxin-dependent (E)-4-hydroxy-3-methylbut-2-enyl-diphosphate synthase, partial [Elusimicrobiota bacterium]
KSAIGIGSLLEDGIGDTIRVSLTEDPEREVPVCQVLAKPFHNREQEPARAESKKAVYHCADFYSYKRRKADYFPVGPFVTGGLDLVRVITKVPKIMTADAILDLHEVLLGRASGADLEILEFPVTDKDSLERLRDIRVKLSTETSRLAYLARVEGPLALALDAVKIADMICWATPVEKEYAAYLDAIKATGMVNLVEADTAELARKYEAASLYKVVPTMTSLRGTDSGKLIREYRALAAYGGTSPILIRAPRENTPDEQVMRASTLIGGLLCDGVGDVVSIDADLPFERGLSLLYNVLQGAGVRITKTEFVSCPSCGRTLFDLQTTTERIKARTGHLKGVKIAIMGCIVNGPGEMADADFGYVGGAPDSINLYVGKECVQKGISFAKSDDALVELIKKHGKWVEP